MAHVVTAIGVDSTTTLDGFTVTAGSASSYTPNDQGGGMYNRVTIPADLDGQPRVSGMAVDKTLRGRTEADWL